MKALELTVYPLAPPRPFLDGWHACRRWDVERDIERHEMIAKRLTDTELAAEYWAPTWLTMPDADWDGDFAGTSLRMRGRMDTLHRFATLPHYDEPQP